MKHSQKSCISVSCKVSTGSEVEFDLLAKQAGRRFGKRKANPSGALRALGSEPILSQEEAHRVVELLDGASTSELKKAPKALGNILKTETGGNKSVKKIADEMNA